MQINLIKDRLKIYATRTKQEEINALKEIYQEIALAGLARSDFFKLAAFQGGTCLRIVHQLRRFSEDLDFVLLTSEKKFKWDIFLHAITLEFNSFGINLSVKERALAEGAIRTAFIKEDSFGRVLELKYKKLPSDEQVIKIKLEIDTAPPQGSDYESTFLTYPYPFSITTQKLTSLFASKAHALLCRKYIKGRDWFDFLWYISKNVSINYLLLKNALQQAGPYKDRKIPFDQKWLVNEFEKKIKSIDWKIARLDVENFLTSEDRKFVSSWNEELFLNQLNKLQID